jgi:two-component system, cell cycle sensor histidine kinase and response regulator CckA
LKHILGDRVTLELDCPPGVSCVRGDTAMIGQIVMNLAMNARDAMPAGGSFIVSTNSVEIDRNYVRTHREARPGNFVCMIVTDTGTGIAPEVLRHLFEPFFTTKEVGKGTGLGLAAVYGIIKQHKGWIDVQSQLGRGTTFRIFLPAESKIVHAVPTFSRARPGSETVLLVEDEPELLDLVGEILQSSGYHVLPASSGKKALEVWRESSQEIDLLLTDMKMPDGIGGLELAQMLVADNPRLKVLYTSGFSPDYIEPRINLREGVNFVQKPFPPEKLLATIRYVLEPS